MIMKQIEYIFVWHIKITFQLSLNQHPYLCSYAIFYEVQSLILCTVPNFPHQNVPGFNKEKCTRDQQGKVLCKFHYLSLDCMIWFSLFELDCILWLRNDCIFKITFLQVNFKQAVNKRNKSHRSTIYQINPDYQLELFHDKIVPQRPT